MIPTTRPPSQRGGRRPGVYALGKHHRWPEPTGAFWAFASVLAILGVVGLMLMVGLRPARAQDIDEARLVADAVATLVAPTPEPTSTEAPRYSPSARGGRQVVEELAAQHFAPAWVPWVVRTARCESGWDLYAYSAGYDRRLGVFYEHIGAMQVDGVSWRRVAAGNILEPAVNFVVAAYVLEQQGTRAWPFCGR